MIGGADDGTVLSLGHPVPFTVFVKVRQAIACDQGTHSARTPPRTQSCQRKISVTDLPVVLGRISDSVRLEWHLPRPHGIVRREPHAYASRWIGGSIGHCSR